MLKHRRDKQPTWEAVDELTRLYQAWLALLLRRVGTKEIRVTVGELGEALSHPLCEVTREGDAYVIRLEAPDDHHVSREVSHESASV